MPLFSSKFTFKKSPQRQRNLEEIEQNNLKDDNSSVESNDEEKYSEDEAAQGVSQTESKRAHKTPQMNAAHNKVAKELPSKSITTKNPPFEHSLEAPKSVRPRNKKGTQSYAKKNQLMLCLDQGVCFHFDSKQGTWRNDALLLRPETNKPTTPSGIPSELIISELTNKNKILAEENRLLKLKIEILMEMVTETTAELNLKDKPTVNNNNNK